MLRAAEQAERQLRPVDACRVSPEPRAILLYWSAVVARLIEPASMQKDTITVTNCAFQVNQAILRVHIAVLVDGAAHIGSNQRVTIRA